MKLIFTIFTTLQIISTFAQPPSIQWQKSLGGSLYDNVQQIIQTQEGGYLFTGHSQSSNYDVSTNFGQYDFWVVKTDYYGNIEWQKSHGGSGIDQSYAVLQMNDGSFIIGGSTQSNDGNISVSYGNFDIWIIKLSNIGVLLWQKNFGGTSNDFCRSAVKTNDGGFIIAGYTESNDIDITSNNGFADCWIIKFDNEGDIEWQKTIGGTLSEFAYSIQQTTDGGYIFAGQSESNIVGNLGGLDGYFVKLDSLGNIVWQKNYGGSLNDYIRRIFQTKDGGYLAVGESYSTDFDAATNHGSRDFFVIKLDANGVKEWSKCYGGSNNDYARWVIQATDDNFVIAGESYSDDGDATFNHGSAEYWLVKIGQTGNLIWQKSYGGSGHDDPSCILQTPDNGFIVAGHSFSPNDGDVTGNHGDDDVWLVKFANEENCLENLDLKLTIKYDSPIFKANYDIKSVVKIENPSAIIEYKAGKSILLNPGFQTTGNNIFKAEIENCQN